MKLGTVKQRIDSSFVSLGVTASTQFLIVALPDGTILEVASGTNWSFRYLGTSVIWSTLPSAYGGSIAGAILGRNGNLYVMSHEKTSGGYYRISTLYRVNISTKTWTALQTWTGSSSSNTERIYHSYHGDSEYAAIVVDYNGGGNSRLYSFNMNTEAIALLRDYQTSDGQSCVPFSAYVYEGTVDEDGYVYLTTWPDTGTLYYRRVTLSSYASTLIDNNASGYDYRALPGGYHVRSDTPQRIYNQARSTFWNVGIDVYGATRISTGGASDGTWIINTASGIYSAILDTAGSITKTQLIAATGDYYGGWISYRGTYLSGQRYDPSNPSDFFVFMRNSSYNQVVGRAAFGRGETL